MLKELAPKILSFEMPEANKALTMINISWWNSKDMNFWLSIMSYSENIEIIVMRILCWIFIRYIVLFKFD